MQFTHDVAIVGSGIVGLATAYQLLTKDPDLRILVIDKESSYCMHQSSHNSGVIHSGLYYQPGSSKATTCLTGYKQLLDFCSQYGIKYEICGKVVVAVNQDECSRIPSLIERGVQNGLLGLKHWSKQELREREPYCCGLEAIYVPQTGIISYEDVASALFGLLSKLNVDFLFNSKVNRVTPQQDGSFVDVIFDSNQTHSARTVVCCAGLQSDRLAAKSDLSLSSRILPFRGEYYQLSEEASHLVNHLIYPVPNPEFPFLGVHFTRMIHGGVECGPNAVIALSRESYTKYGFSLVDACDTLFYPGFSKLASRYWEEGFNEIVRSFWKPAFLSALQKLIPDIKSNDLTTGGMGIRAQACGASGSLLDDFVLTGSGKVLHVINAPSPAATSCFGIGHDLANITLQSLK